MARLRRRRGGLRSGHEGPGCQHQPLHADGQPCDAEKPYEDAACNTLKLTFSKPAPYFHTVMSLWVTYPAKEENITEGGENWWNSSKYQIGNGPFILKSLEPFVTGYFTPNPNYWGDKAKVDIEYSYITDTRRGLRGLQEQRVRHHRRWLPRICEVIKADPALSKEADDLPRLLHLRRHVPSVEGTVHRSEGARGVCRCASTARAG